MKIEIKSHSPSFGGGRGIRAGYHSVLVDGKRVDSFLSRSHARRKVETLKKALKAAG